MNKRSCGFVAILLAAAVQTLPARAQITWNDIVAFRAPADNPTYAALQLAKGQPDECFAGVGVDYPPLSPGGTCSTGVPKKNLGYIWGLTEAGLGVPGFAGDDIWFGTFANPLCSGAAGGIIEPEPDLTVSWVCEFGQSMLARRPVAPLPPASGDWRLPRVYSYNLVQARLTDRTPADAAFYGITGMRSAGSLGSLVFVAGPTFQTDVVFAAWDAASGTYRGSCRATALNQIRQWIVVNGVLYAGAGRDVGDGVILRWRGSAADPFLGAGRVSEYCGFEVVGTMPGFPAYLTTYNNQRIVASAWNRTSLEAAHRAGSTAPTRPLTAGVYLGPPLGADGQYDAGDARRPWVRIWSPLQYETDPVVASTTGGGAITFWNGWLWFGSMQNNATAASSHSKCALPICYGPPATPQESLDLSFQTSRAASIWRARLVEGSGVEIQLLYGQSELPALVPGTRTFEMKPTGWTARLGAAGFGNPFVTYAWAAAAGTDDLLFGMYDYRYVFDVRLGVFTGGSIDTRRGYGADLWRFTDADSPATPETVRGFGNFTNYGVRNMLRLKGGDELIIGTASGLTLEPAAGWELLQLTPPTVEPARRR